MNNNRLIKPLTHLVILFGLVFLFTPSALKAQKFSEKILDYTVNFSINEDSTVTLTELITYDFGSLQRHGIFRDIPVKYKTSSGNNVSIGVRNIHVNDGDTGGTLNFTTSKKGSELEIKIGDPNQLITGTHKYVISYTVDRAINFFADHDELYWNAIGTNWQVEIAQAQVIGGGPGGVNKDSIQTACFTGVLGSKASDCTISFNSKDQAVYKANKVLEAGEGFSVVFGIPKGLIHQAPLWQRIAQTISDNIVLGLPVLIFIIMYFIWRKYGKDAKGKGTIIAQYDPPKDMTPLEMGLALTDKIDNKDISAEIIYLATKGYIKITRVEKKKLLMFDSVDYQLERIGTTGSDVKTFDTELLDLLFSEGSTTFVAKLKSNHSLGNRLQSDEKPLFEDLEKQGFFKKNPQTVKGLYVVIGLLVGFGLSFLLSRIAGGFGLLSGIVSALIVFAFARIMPARTQKGAEMKEYILGFKEYLSVVEKDRLKFFNAPEKNPERFEKLLPYAMVLGVEKEWAQQFEGIYNKQPSWYNDPTHPVFTAYLLSNSLGDFRSSVGTAIVAGSRAASGGSGFGGGGFSGGGFGGGGGGSW